MHWKMKSHEFLNVDKGGGRSGRVFGTLLLVTNMEKVPTGPNADVAYYDNMSRVWPNREAC